MAHQRLGSSHALCPDAMVTSNLFISVELPVEVYQQKEQALVTLLAVTQNRPPGVIHQSSVSKSAPRGGSPSAGGVELVR